MISSTSSFDPISTASKSARLTCPLCRVDFMLSDVIRHIQYFHAAGSAAGQEGELDEWECTTCDYRTLALEPLAQHCLASQHPVSKAVKIETSVNRETRQIKVLQEIQLKLLRNPFQCNGNCSCQGAPTIFRLQPQQNDPSSGTPDKQQQYNAPLTTSANSSWTQNSNKPPADSGTSGDAPNQFIDSAMMVGSDWKRKRHQKSEFSFTPKKKTKCRSSKQSDRSSDESSKQSDRLPKSKESDLLPKSKQSNRLPKSKQSDPLLLSSNKNQAEVHQSAGQTKKSKLIKTDGRNRMIKKDMKKPDVERLKLKIAQIQQLRSLRQKYVLDTTKYENDVRQALTEIEDSEHPPTEIGDSEPSHLTEIGNSEPSLGEIDDSAVSKATSESLNNLSYNSDDTKNDNLCHSKSMDVDHFESKDSNLNFIVDEEAAVNDTTSNESPQQDLEEISKQLMDTVNNLQDKVANKNKYGLEDQISEKHIDYCENQVAEERSDDFQDQVAEKHRESDRDDYILKNAIWKNDYGLDGDSGCLIGKLSDLDTPDQTSDQLHQQNRSSYSNVMSTPEFSAAPEPESASSYGRIKKKIASSLNRFETKIPYSSNPIKREINSSKNRIKTEIASSNNLIKTEIASSSNRIKTKQKKKLLAAASSNRIKTEFPSSFTNVPFRNRKFDADNFQPSYSSAAVGERMGRGRYRKYGMSPTKRRRNLTDSLLTCLECLDCLGRQMIVRDPTQAVQHVLGCHVNEKMKLPYGCTICTRGFRRADAVNKHIAGEHQAADEDRGEDDGNGKVYWKFPAFASELWAQTEHCFVDVKNRVDFKARFFARINELIDCTPLGTLVEETSEN